MPTFSATLTAVSYLVEPDNLLVVIPRFFISFSSVFDNTVVPPTINAVFTFKLLSMSFNWFWLLKEVFSANKIGALYFEANGAEHRASG